MQKHRLTSTGHSLECNGHKAANSDISAASLFLDWLEKSLLSCCCSVFTWLNWKTLFQHALYSLPEFTFSVHEECSTQMCDSCHTDTEINISFCCLPLLLICCSSRQRLSVCLSAEIEKSFHVPFLLPSPSRLLFWILQPDAAESIWGLLKSDAGCVHAAAHSEGLLYVFLWAGTHQHIFKMTAWPCDQNLFLPSLFCFFHHSAEWGC